jgi:hypothetical protein
MNIKDQESLRINFIKLFHYIKLYKTESSEALQVLVIGIQS